MSHLQGGDELQVQRSTSQYFAAADSKEVSSRRQSNANRHRPSTEVAGLFSNMKELNKRLKAMTKVNGPGSKDSNDTGGQREKLRQKMREACLRILRVDPEFAQLHDIEGMLWKGVYHQRIEEFRQQLRKASSFRQKNSENSKVEQRIAALKKSFKSFLMDARKFYEILLQEHLRLAHVGIKRSKTSPRAEELVLIDLLRHGNGNTASSSLSPARDPAAPHAAEFFGLALATCHRCLIFLGDLERYIQTNELHEQRTWRRSRRFYMQALDLVPTNGNPHNQLAVVASYRNDELCAVYRYCRSLNVEEPFPTAQQNLKLMLDKNQTKLMKLLGDAVTWEGAIQESLAKDPQTATMMLLLNLIGTLYLPRVADFNYFALKESLVIQNFDHCASPLSPEEAQDSASRCLMVLVVCISVLHNPFEEDGNMMRSDEHEGHRRSLAKIFLFRLMTVAVERTTPDNFDYLDSIGVLCDWLRVEPKVMYPEQQAPLTAARMETDSRLALWNGLSDLVQRLRPAPDILGSAPSKLPVELPEAMELRGFAPLSACYGFISRDFQLMRGRGDGSAGVVSSECRSHDQLDAQEILRARFWKVAQFVEEVLIPNKLVVPRSQPRTSSAPAPAPDTISPAQHSTSMGGTSAGRGADANGVMGAEAMDWFGMHSDEKEQGSPLSSQPTHAPKTPLHGHSAADTSQPFVGGAGRLRLDAAADSLPEEAVLDMGPRIFGRSVSLASPSRMGASTGDGYARPTVVSRSVVAPLWDSSTPNRGGAHDGMDAAAGGWPASPVSQAYRSPSASGVGLAAADAYAREFPFPGSHSPPTMNSGDVFSSSPHLMALGMPRQNMWSPDQHGAAGQMQQQQSLNQFHLQQLPPHHQQEQQQQQQQQFGSGFVHMNLGTHPIPSPVHALQSMPPRG